MKKPMRGGIDITMKVPSHQYEPMIAFYRDIIGLKRLTDDDDEDAVIFEFGPNKLWIEAAPGMSQAEIWLELVTDNFRTAAQHLEKKGVVRCDAIEMLPSYVKGGWYTSPASIVHMVREPTPGDEIVPARSVQ